MRHLKLRQKGLLVIKVTALSACLEILAACSSLDIFSWNSLESGSNQSLEKGVSRTVFSLDPASEIALKRDCDKDKSHSPAFPVSAPGIRLPAPRLEVNHEVRRELAKYLRGNGRSISQSLKRQEELFPVLAKILHDEGVPDELLNLALIESGFRPSAVSHAGAVGMWQFMVPTARLYGLEVSRRVDERKDPILSTIAAARHLKDLFAKYNDWYLVLAAYNAGEGALAKASSAEGRMDYWSMVRSGRIASETARFVPKFIAASILQKLYHRYGGEVQLAQYVDRHVVVVGSVGSKPRYAFNMESESLVRRG